MQFSSIILAAATLAVSATAAVLPRDGARLAQFRVFGADGCHDLNYGFYTVDQSDANTCKTFVNAPSVKSLNLEAMNSPAANGCSFFIYTSTDCGAGRRAIPVQSCQELPADATEWASWQIFCPSGAAA
ncbi:hypothetical protein F4821DRAFT_232255 [Hypoxylon rubiginosum]|uniref:Uncharacterized protein n=1 Tax=Hypoxylon rubiginosum TaxID=110542 RepID=A0ACC0D8T5_9PEZI|nr:hypothetical protein F4821DRAFT_232255 [Hypoxylon rubiginosum]